MSNSGKRCFIGGLSWDTDDSALRGFFEKFGAVADAKVIVDRDSGRSKGFGFVTFETTEEANRAIDEKDLELDGRSINVQMAQERSAREDRGDRSRGGNRSRGGDYYRGSDSYRGDRRDDRRDDRRENRRDDRRESSPRRERSPRQHALLISMLLEQQSSLKDQVKILLTKELLEEKEQLSYLNTITNLSSLDSLKQEPTLLKEKTELQISDQTTLAYNEYSSFLAANRCGNNIKEGYSSLDKKLQNFLLSLPELEKSLLKFNQDTQPILEEGKDCKLILSQLPKILDLLEIPTLIHTFIKNGYYEEAMDLKVHVNRLLQRHPDIELLKKVAVEVKEASAIMLSQLTELLSGDVKLPLCIRVIGYLRRMEAFPEPEIRIVFLQHRNYFLQNLFHQITLNLKKNIELEDKNKKNFSKSGENLQKGNNVSENQIKPNISTNPQLEFLRKYIEASREHFFNIVTQYKSIFSENNQLYYSSNSTECFLDEKSVSVCTNTILSSFVKYNLDQFIKVLDVCFFFFYVTK
ncbi:conserved oligomeric Golgi complex component [Lobulomyces angularis]|nr:conserved oligomeric Golgi complex component [Lobulomyces angularis]